MISNIVVQEVAQSLQAAGISKAQETFQLVVLPVGYFGMSCATDRLYQWYPAVAQPQQAAKHQRPACSVPYSRMGERIGRV